MSQARACARLSFLALLVLSACDSGTEPLRPAAFRVLSGEGGRASVGSPLASPPAVRVTTADGRAVPGVDVLFTVTSGNGTLSGAHRRTDAAGTATAGTWTLGTQAGPQTITVTSPRMPGVTATITATATADAPTGLTVVAQPSVTAASGAPLLAQPAVQLVDRFGNASPQAGISVTAAAVGDVTLSGATAQTDAEGRATFTALALQGPHGTYRLRFSAAGLGEAQAAAETELTGGAPHHLELVAQPGGSNLAGMRLRPAPALRALDEYGNSVTLTTVAVTATLEGSAGVLSGTTTRLAQNGTIAFDDLRISGEGRFRLRFAADGLDPITTDSFSVATQVDLSCAALGMQGVRLAFTLGEMVRHTTVEAAAPACLEFDAATAAGQQYLVLFENMPLLGTAEAALFPGAGAYPALEFALESQPAAPVGDVLALSRAFPNALAGAEERHHWNFDGTPIYEAHVPELPGGVPEPRLLRDGRAFPLSSLMVHPLVGDTVEVYLQGIDRLSIPSGTQKAVVRHISNELIIAEDVRLATLVRQNGGTNTPITAAVLDSITAQYAAYSRVQGDLLFEGRHNSAVESWGSPPRVLAVHTLMYADNLWGYTWPYMHYFAFDYWVGTNGSTRGLAQHPQRVADNVFMHEIAHMRHHGLAERAGVSTAARGNRWLVEGFARFSERLPIAMRLLGATMPSRVGNVVLPTNPAFGGTYFFDDVPTYLQAGFAMVAGYGSSSFVFDYFADQVALRGGDPLAALREFVLYGGSESTLNPVLSRWLGETITFGELFTRARVALYSDDYGAGLPAATQYLQYQLRASRPPGSNSAIDPRNAWLKLSPGTPEEVAPVPLPAGTARGVVIDGTVAGAGSARILVDMTAGENGVISITRIR